MYYPHIPGFPLSKLELVTFLLHLLYLDALYFFSCLIALARTSSSVAIVE